MQYLKKVCRGANPDERALLARYTEFFLRSANVYCVVFVWFADVALFGEEWGSVVSTFIYVVFGVYIYRTGIKKRDTKLKYFGALMVIGSAGWLILLTYVLLSVVGSVVALVLIGSVLINAAWREKNKRLNN